MPSHLHMIGILVFVSVPFARIESLLCRSSLPAAEEQMPNNRHDGLEDEIVQTNIRQLLVQSVLVSVSLTLHVHVPLCLTEAHAFAPYIDKLSFLFPTFHPLSSPSFASNFLPFQIPAPAGCLCRDRAVRMMRRSCLS